jgi:hypothetical protein
MNEPISSPSRWLQCIHEYLFSLNLAWIIIWFERVHSKSLGGHVLAHYISVLVGGAYQLVTPIGGYPILEQITWSFGVATVGFLLLRLLSGFAITNVALRTIAGAIAIAAFPTATLFFGLAYPDCCAELNKIGLALETVFVLICGILFYLNKPWISRPLMILALVLHFSLWAWATSSYVNVPSFFSDISILRNSEYYHPWRRTLGALAFKTVFKYGFSAFGLLASIIWVRYIRRSPDVPHAECAQASV